jgi:hypothetical protein
VERHADSYLTLERSDASLAGERKLTEQQQAELTGVMTRFLPDAPLTWMIGLGADPVAAELADEAAEPAVTGTAA